jgi:hypothetical protein
MINACHKMCGADQVDAVLNWPAARRRLGSGAACRRQSSAVPEA